MISDNQTWTIIKKELYQRRWALFGFSLAAILFILLYISIFPSFQKETAKLNDLFDAYPKAVLQAFNIDQLQFSTFEGYISAEHFSFVWPLMAIFLALSLAGVGFAGEIEKGTMAFLLSQPVSRAKIYWAKYSSGILALTAFTTLSILLIIPLAKIQNIEVNSVNVLKTAVLSLCFVWAVYSLAILVSSVTSEKNRTYFALGGLLLIMYVANVVSGLVTPLKSLKYVSFFNYYAPSKTLTTGVLPISSLVIFCAVTVIAMILGYIFFSRRDISV